MIKLSLWLPSPSNLLKTSPERPLLPFHYSYFIHTIAAMNAMNDPDNSANAIDPTDLNLFGQSRTTDFDDLDVRMPIAELIQEFMSVQTQIVDPVTGYAMTVEEMKLDLPIELKVAVAGDRVTHVKASPPTQLFETTVMPVFHRLRLRVVREYGEE